MTVTTYIGLGANLGNPEEQLTGALQALAKMPQTKVVAFSKLYKSRPVGPGQQEDYCNAAAALETELLPDALLDELQAIEQTFGRERIIRWGARTLDLDILLYGNDVIDTERLTIPHKEMHWRSFVLIPLAEIAPNNDFILPDGSCLAYFLDKCDKSALDLPGKEWSVCIRLGL